MNWITFSLHQWTTGASLSILTKIVNWFSIMININKAFITSNAWFKLGEFKKKITSRTVNLIVLVYKSVQIQNPHISHTFISIQLK